MKLNFKIVEDYLVLHTLSAANDNRFIPNIDKQSVINFQNFVWNTSKEMYELLTSRSNPFNNLDNCGTKLESFLAEIKSSNELSEVIKQTQESLLLVKKEWEDNFNKSYKIIKEITGINFREAIFTVFLTHPSLQNGYYAGKSSICWSYRNDFENYNTVYLWHEILHSKFKIDELSHTLIQLVTDNELRIRLNGGTYPPFEGHQELFHLMEKLLPEWDVYLQNKEVKDIFKFYKEVKLKYS